MSDQVVSDGRLNGAKLVDISTQITADANGTVNIIGASLESREGTIVGNFFRERANSLLSIGGGKLKEFISRADVEITGSLEQKTYQEGYATNQLILAAPSSCFTPVSPWMPPIFSGPVSLFGNPVLLFSIIAIAAVSASDSQSKNSYSKNRETMPLIITDNQELEDQLFG